MEKVCRNCAPKASSRPLFNLILVNSPKQPVHARNSFENEIFGKRIIKKTCLIFSFTPSLFL